jgi:signal recognition particle receptor subunit beta
VSTVNVSAREVAAKIVYYGPGLSGKTTNLRRIHDTVKPTVRGELTALATEGDRTLFFDFLPVRVERINNCALRLGLYTVPGQVFYNATRKLVLQGADGVVFIADSQPDALERNTESMENLVENLRDEGLDPATFPLVIQFNKRDLKRVMPIAKLHEALNRFGAPEFEASATEGQGVLDTLKAITRLVIRDLKARGVVSQPGPRVGTPPANISPAARGASLETQIQGVLDAEPPEPPPTAPPPHASDDVEDTDPAGRLHQLKPVEHASDDAPQAWDPAQPLGSFLGTLAPPSLRSEIVALEVSFAAGDHREVVGSTLRLLRTLAGTDRGEEILGGYLLGLDGRELRRLLDLSSGSPDRDDAAFALYLLAQACVRAG